MTGASDAIYEILCRETSLDRAHLRDDATLEELDISSLDFASALFALEDECDVVIEPDRFGPQTTIGELVGYIAGQSSG